MDEWIDGVSEWVGLVLLKLHDGMEWNGRKIRQIGRRAVMEVLRAVLDATSVAPFFFFLE